MNRIVELIAPKSVLGWVLKPAAYIVAIIGVNAAIRLILFGTLVYELWFIALIVTLVALPLVIPILALIAHMHRLQIQLARVAATDMLTGLPNRRAFFERIAALRRSDQSDTVLMIDVDHFKRINDTYGHAVGDLCLREVTQLIRGSLRDCDVLARLGGEEFAAYLPHLHPFQATPVANRIARGGTVEVAGVPSPLPITVSVGIAALEPGAPFHAALSVADDALYRAKADGRACARIADTRGADAKAYPKRTGAP